MIVPGTEEREPELPLADLEQSPEDELVEWWNEDTPGHDLRRGEAEGDDMLPVILGLVATGVVCVLLGVIVAPMVLASIFENNLGIVVENSADLRPLGALLGLLTAAFIGAIGVWAAGPRR